MKPLFIFALLCLLPSCGTTIITRGDQVVVQQGLLADIGGSGVSITTPNGTTIKSVQKGYKGTAVAKTALLTYGLAVSAVEGTKAVVSNNGVKTAALTETTKQKAAVEATRQAEIAAKGAATSEAVQSGAQVNPITISPP